MKESTFEKYKLVIDEYFVNGMNGTKAYQKLYKKSSDENAANRFRDLVRISEIQSYLKEKQSNKANELGITLENQLLELNDIKLLSKEDKRYSDSINAIKEQNKLLGLYEIDNRQKNAKESVDYSRLTNEEIITLSILQKKALTNE